MRTKQLVGFCDLFSAVVNIYGEHDNIQMEVLEWMIQLNRKGRTSIVYALEEAIP
jgi:hypothetical protein